jgi:hypothetical protein
MLMGALGWSCPSAVRSVLLLTWLPSPGVIPDLLSDPGAGGTLSRVCSPPIGLHRTRRPLDPSRLWVRVGSVLGVSRLVPESRVTRASRASLSLHDSRDST